eukprot:966421-Rhodomonas_salina.1
MMHHHTQSGDSTAPQAPAGPTSSLPRRQTVLGEWDFVVSTCAGMQIRAHTSMTLACAAISLVPLIVEPCLQFLQCSRYRVAFLWNGAFCDVVKGQ